MQTLLQAQALLSRKPFDKQRLWTQGASIFNQLFLHFSRAPSLYFHTHFLFCRFFTRFNSSVAYTGVSYHRQNHFLTDYLMVSIVLYTLSHILSHSSSLSLLRGITHPHICFRKKIFLSHTRSLKVIIYLA